MPESHLPITGGCLCGSIRFVSDAPPVRGAFCHCTMCRRSYGLFGAFLRFGPTVRFVRGEPIQYRSSAIARRGFCASCGSALTFAYDGNPDLWLSLGSLDHPEDWPMTPWAAWGPSRHVETGSLLPWYEPGDGLPLVPDALDDLKRGARSQSGRTS